MARRTPGKMKPRLRVKRSRNGKGIFAGKNFLKGEILFEVKGVFISGDEEDDLDEKTRSNTFRFDKRKYISPAGTIGDFLNHSCEPNAFVSKRKGRLFIVALQNIDRDKEVAIDYSTILAADDSWEMKCKCGSKKCRKTIKKFASLPSSVKRKYISLGAVPSYIWK